MDLFNLSGRTAVVLGGTGVLGQAMAGGLTRAGARVAVTGRSADRLQTMVERGLAAHGWVLDAAEGGALNRAATVCVAELGRVDILVSAIGGNLKAATTSSSASFFDLPEVALREVLDLNLMQGAVLPAQAFGRSMATNPDGGVIIFVSSMAAWRPLTRVPGYAAAKAAVSNFTQWLAVEMARTGGSRVRVNALAPGFFLTEQNRALLTDPQTDELTERGRSILEHTPMGRFGQPEDLVGPLVWLASDAARFVTGVVVSVDGGFQAFGGV